MSEKRRDFRRQLVKSHYLKIDEQLLQLEVRCSDHPKGSHVNHSCPPLPKKSAGYVDNVAQIWSEISA
jgi:hypothetical protein